VSEDFKRRRGSARNYFCYGV